jgi:hypothetical protein
MNNLGAALLAIPLSILIFIGFILPFHPEYQDAVRKQQNEARQAALVQESLDGDVSSCLKTQSAWKCFVKLDQMDAATPVPPEAGASRTRRLAAAVPAKDVLAFCLEPRKVDCATRMVGKGWSADDLTSAMKD